MQWWQILLVLVDLYLLLSLAPAIAAQVLIWLLKRHGPYMEAEQERLDSLAAAFARQQERWPEMPRTGPYAEVDVLAARHLQGLDALLASTESEIDRAGARPLLSLTFRQAMTLQGWLPLSDALSAWIERRSVRLRIGEADGHRLALRDLERQARAIPDQVRNELQVARADINRLVVLAEEEQNQGTLGIEGALHELARLYREIEQSLDQLVDCEQDALPSMVTVLTETNQEMTQQIRELDEGLQRVISTRRQAINTYDRLNSAVGVIQERWQGLVQRRVAEPVLERSVQEMTRNVKLFGEYLDQHTFEGYARLLQLAEGMDEKIEVVAQEMDQVQDMMVRARSGIDGDVKSLADAQALLESLTQEFPLFEPDQSQSLVEAATRTYLEAEHQLGLGTVKGYETAIRQAEVASARLSEAQELAEPVPDRIARSNDILAELTAEEISTWRSRALSVREEMQIYGQHWDAGPSNDLTQALAGLEQVEVDLERVPPNVRYQRAFRQSELSQAIQILDHAGSTMQLSRETIEALEQEHSRISDRRTRLEADLETLTQRVIPGIEMLRSTMLPELADRYDALIQDIAQDLESLEDPSITDYDNAVDEWLPNIVHEFQEIQSTHENDLLHYRTLATEAVEGVQRAWERLDRVQPRQVPGPAESVDQMEADVNAYMADANQHGDDPKVLQELVGRRAQGLTSRMDAMREEIIEGRKTLDNIVRQYRRRIQNLRTLRSRVNTLATSNQWPQLPWDLEQAETAWTEIMALERDSQTSPYLADVNDQMQKALNTTISAEKFYDALEHHMSTAFTRLDTEYRAVTVALERTQRRIDRLREEGEEEIVDNLERACDAAMRYVEMARAATTFEDAYRHLREAQGPMTRY